MFDPGLLVYKEHLAFPSEAMPQFPLLYFAGFTYHTADGPTSISLLRSGFLVLNAKVLTLWPSIQAPQVLPGLSAQLSQSPLDQDFTAPWHSSTGPTLEPSSLHFSRQLSFPASLQGEPPPSSFLVPALSSLRERHPPFYNRCRTQPAIT